MSTTSTTQGLGRLARLIRKELSSILRDRRTIITLVLMPLLVYPLLSIAFRTFLIASATEKTSGSDYRLGCETQQEQAVFTAHYKRGQTLLKQIPSSHAGRPEPEVRIGSPFDVQEALLEGKIDVGIQVHGLRASTHPKQAQTLLCELMYLEASSRGRAAKEYVERRLDAANLPFLVHPLLVPEERSSELTFRPAVAALGGQALAATGFPRPVVLLAQERPLRREESETPVPLSAMIPLILILMTMTGAVYPAIDLTAGERERGTLEVLIAAPIPRLGLLFAKYFSVVTIAVMTAVVNLVSMTVTLQLSGLGALVFKDSGVSLVVILKVFGLMLLFAAFFSAVLLTVTSFARSFKEAQAYLIPLMLIAMAPGMLSLMPSIKLQGTMRVAPLLNIVLLTRDVLENQASAGTAVAVVISTLVYAVAAVAIAARIFGAEAVLYSEQASWADTFRRPPEARDTASLSSALFCLAIMFPISYLLAALLDRLGHSHLDAELVLRAISNFVLFGAIPAGFAWMSRVRWGLGLRLERRAAWAWGPAVILGVSLWPLAELINRLLTEVGIATLPGRDLHVDTERTDYWRSQPPVIFVLLRGVVPAVLEELFFRGFLLAALLRATRPRVAIPASALFFGLFHLVDQQLVIVERAVISTLLGLLLGWLAWRCGSVVPGMIVHTLHNSCLLLLFYYEKQLPESIWYSPLTQQVSPAVLLVALGSVIAALIWLLQAAPAAAQE
jgi:ABC-type Na+ efflux pump permease subunit/membrane protease YdiL (CAAX protease family)